MPSCPSIQLFFALAFSGAAWKKRQDRRLLRPAASLPDGELAKMGGEDPCSRKEVQYKNIHYENRCYHLHIAATSMHVREEGGGEAGGGEKVNVRGCT